MARTDILRRQHDAAVVLVEEINGSIQNFDEPRDAYAIALRLAKLNGLLRIHFAQEDRSLYPAMMASSDAQVADTAATFQREMGYLGAAFASFIDRWGMSAAIAANFDQFRDESAELFGKLANRIERENEELYRLADTIDGALRPVA